MIESGQLTEEQARSHPRKHFITRALGVSVMEEGEFDELELEPTDKLLLCTDGLTNMVDDGSLSELLHNSATVDILIQSALDGGGTDNITAVLMEQGE
jgi:protein phosphatase